MNPSLTGACFLLRSAWQAVYQPFLIHLRQLTSLRYGSLCSAVAALLVGLLADVLPAADGVANDAASPEILASDELALVRELATATLETCGVAPGAIARGKTNTLGFRAITPGGYPAIWIQDFTMNFSSGLIAREDGLRHLQLILEKQNGPEPKDLGQQVVISAHAIPDHINVDGAPVFFPGTYDPLANMNGDWGFRPPSNNQFDVIWLAHMLARSGDVKALLSREVGGRTVYERLKLAFAVPEINPATQLVRTTAERRAVGFIFYDAIEMTGDLLMASLIRYRAALHLAWLATKMDQPEDAKHYTDVAQQIRSHILPVFGDTDGTHGGWLKASNGISGQSDVWGSIYAIYIGAVEGEARAALLRTITAALAKPGEIEFEGALRHVPLSGDASPTTMWEKARHPKNRYMNGAYWHVPVGWSDKKSLFAPFPQLARAVSSRGALKENPDPGRRGKHLHGGDHFRHPFGLVNARAHLERVGGLLHRLPCRGGYRRSADERVLLPRVIDFAKEEGSLDDRVGGLTPRAIRLGQDFFFPSGFRVELQQELERLGQFSRVIRGGIRSSRPALAQ